MKLNLDLTRVQAKMLMKLAHEPGKTPIEATLRSKLYQAAQNALASSEDGWILGSKAYNGNFYVVEKPIIQYGISYDVSMDIDLARTFKTKAEAITYNNMLLKPLINPFVRRLKNCR